MKTTSPLAAFFAARGYNTLQIAGPVTPAPLAPTGASFSTACASTWEAASLKSVTNPASVSKRPRSAGFAPPASFEARVDVSSADTLLRAVTIAADSFAPDGHRAKTYVAGGSARAVLDHVFFGTELAWNDLDVFVVLPEREIDAGRAVEIARALEEGGVGTFLPETMVERVRPDAHDETIVHKAGHAVAFKTPYQRQKLDIGLIPESCGLPLNGLFTIERVQIPINGAWGLSDFIGRAEDEFASCRKLCGDAARARNLAYHRLRDAGLVIDHGGGGYELWLRGEVAIHNRNYLKHDPWGMAIRIVRMYAKVGQQLPPALREEMRAASGKKIELEDRQRFERHLFRLLRDLKAAEELKTLGDTGFLERFDPQLAALVGESTLQDLNRLFENADRRAAAQNQDAGVIRWEMLRRRL